MWKGLVVISEQDGNHGLEFHLKPTALLEFPHLLGSIQKRCLNFTEQQNVTRRT